MTPDEKNFLQTVGRFVQQRIKAWTAPITERAVKLQAQIDQLQLQVRELKSQVRELEEGGIKYCGIYQRAAVYKRGDCVTYGGSMWCAVTDVQPMEWPGKADCWQLSVKHGRDADAGVNAA